MPQLHNYYGMKFSVKRVFRGFCTLFTHKKFAFMLIYFDKDFVSLYIMYTVCTVMQNGMCIVWQLNMALVITHGLMIFIIDGTHTGVICKCQDVATRDRPVCQHKR